MMSLLQSLLAFLVVIALLVTIHEYGHYWVAKRLGVKILRFSIGFGPTLWKRHFGKDRTEFVIAAIPLGGYVQMLDEREGVVPEAELNRAFNRQTLGVRAAIVVAGPVANFLLAIAAYILMFMLGISGMRAMVGEITPDSVAAKAGIKPNYEVMEVNGHTAERWESVVNQTLQSLSRNDSSVTYRLRQHGSEQIQYDADLDLQKLNIDDLAQGHFLEKLGIKPFRPKIPAIVGALSPNGIAEKAGLKVGDKIVRVDALAIADWISLAQYINRHPQQNLTLEVERAGQTNFNVKVTPENVKGDGRIGIAALQDYVLPDKYVVLEHYGLFDAVTHSVEKTWDMSLLTLRLMGKMLSLEVSMKNISGPISIAEFAGRSAQLGMVTFISFLALVSISLGVLNLLPVPMLDGGHLLFYLIEWLKGSPLDDNAQSLLQRVGLTLILMLMSVALVNDVGRLLG